MKRIKFDLDGDNRPYIEGLGDFKKSIFFEQYEQCISLVDSYLKGLANMQEAPRKLVGSLESSNNIIVFDGERGSGKTSCMMSIVNMLTDNRHPMICGDYHYAASAQFDTIQMIEPAFFDKEHNILPLFIARLYRAFQDLENTPRKHELGRLCASMLNKKFVEVQRKLRCMIKEDENDDGLEYLVDMAAAVDIRNDIKEELPYDINAPIINIEDDLIAPGIDTQIPSLHFDGLTISTKQEIQRGDILRDSDIAVVRIDWRQVMPLLHVLWSWRAG